MSSVPTPIRTPASLMNVYDAAALSAVTDLSERSVAYRSRPMDFPDFTRGGWETFPKLPVITD